MSYPIKYVTVRKASQILGYSPGAIIAKRERGDWLENIHWRKAPDGRILINLEAVEQWIEGVKALEIRA